MCIPIDKIDGWSTFHISVPHLRFQRRTHSKASGAPTPESDLSRHKRQTHIATGASASKQRLVWLCFPLVAFLSCSFFRNTPSFYLCSIRALPIDLIYSCFLQSRNADQSFIVFPRRPESKKQSFQYKIKICLITEWLFSSHDWRLQRKLWKHTSNIWFRSLLKRLWGEMTCQIFVPFRLSWLHESLSAP